jgi:hypothetical protein
MTNFNFRISYFMTIRSSALELLHCRQTDRQAFSKLSVRNVLHKDDAEVYHMTHTEHLPLWITRFLEFVHRPVFQKLENATFRKLDVSVLRWGEGKSLTQLGPLERANLNHWTRSECYTPSSESFRIYLPPFCTLIRVYNALLVQCTFSAE